MIAALATVYLATAYAVGCGAGVGTYTKSGTMPVVGYTLAADPTVLPMGSLVKVCLPGGVCVGKVWRVEDTGRKIHGRHIDLFLSDCRAAREWGHQHVTVTVVGFKKTVRLKKSLAPWKRRR